MTIATEPALRAGPRGQDGRLSIHAALIGGRTRLLSLRSQAPLQVLRAAYTEPEVPGLAAVTICSPAGGGLPSDPPGTGGAPDAHAPLRLGTPPRPPPYPGSRPVGLRRAALTRR